MAEKPYDQFLSWLENQPYWLQDATWRLYNKRPIDDSQIKRYAQMCIEQAQNETITYQHVSKDNIESIEIEPQIAINSIRDITAVNALADNTSLNFGTRGVSVVYGLNGAGKSGFMRIFKHVSGHPYAEQIQQNIYKKSREVKPFCRFDISVGDTNQTIDADLTVFGNNAVLRQCDVFDTRISNAYVSSSNSVSYEPFVFTVLKELAVIADKIQAVIQERIDSIQQLNLTRPDFIRDYPDAGWTETITNKTVIPKDCLLWDEKSKARIDELNKLLDSQQVKASLKSKEYQFNQIRSILFELHGLEDRIVKNVCNKLQPLYTDYCKAKRQFELSQRLFSQNATKIDQSSVNIDDYITLWQVGRSYYEKCIHSINGNGFAQSGSICPMCLQPIEGDMFKRFSTVDEYVNGILSETYASAKEEYQALFAEITAHIYTHAQVADILKGIVSAELIEKIVAFYKRIEAWAEESYSEAAYNEIGNLHELKFIAELSEVAEIIGEEIETLKAALNEEKQEEYKKELLHLRYLQWVSQQRELIQAIINNEMQKKNLQSGLQYLRTNKITSESNLLAEALITDAYIKRFNREMGILAPNLKVKLEKGQSIKGRSPYKVVLDTEDKLRKRPEDVLSEGEQRIVALAAFFADATGRKERTPIIIDDPISSLDYNYEDAATKRIVELAKNRQVIVFTHRISLLVGLGDTCKLEGVPFSERYIRGTNSGKGIPDFEDKYHGNITTQLKGLVKRIREVQKMDPYSREYLDACSRISQQLRICVERSVEDVLFQQMVKRFSRRIMTGKLMKMDRIDANDCVMIDSMMTKYSYEEHSQPDDSPCIEIDLEETVSDINRFIAWIKDYTKKMEAKEYNR